MAREVIALLLAVVLAVAGGAKLLDPGGTRRSVRELGLPSSLGWPAAIGLPLVELTLAVGIVVAATSRAAAAAAAGLLAAFTVVLAVNALRGRRIDCGCFGPLHSSPTGVAAAARSAGLTVIAAALAGSAAQPIGWRALGAAGLVAALVVQAAAWLGLMRRYGRALRQIDELRGRPASVASDEPDLAVAGGLTLTGLDGEPVSAADLAAESSGVVLVVTDEQCGACGALYPEIARWQRDLDDTVQVVVVGTGSPERLRAIAEEHELGTMLLADRAPLAAYGVVGAPSALSIDRDGRVAGPVRFGGPDIEALVLDTAESAALEVAHVV